MSDDRGYFDIHCEVCEKYLFSGEYERSFSKGSEYLADEKHYCKKCKRKINNEKLLER